MHNLPKGSNKVSFPLCSSSSPLFSSAFPLLFKMGKKKEPHLLRRCYMAPFYASCTAPPSPLSCSLCCPGLDASDGSCTMWSSRLVQSVSAASAYAQVDCWNTERGPYERGLFTCKEISIISKFSTVSRNSCNLLAFHTPGALYSLLEFQTSPEKGPDPFSSLFPKDPFY